MKKNYITPAIQVAICEASNMIATSLPKSDDTVDGDNALSKKSGINLFDDEDDDENMFNR